MLSPAIVNSFASKCDGKDIVNNRGHPNEFDRLLTNKHYLLLLFDLDG